MSSIPYVLAGDNALADGLDRSGWQRSSAPRNIDMRPVSYEVQRDRFIETLYLFCEPAPRLPAES